MANELYTVVDQEPSRLVAVNGRAVRGWVITFRSTRSGVTGQVEIPDDQFTAENVDKVIRERVAVVDAVHEL